MTIESQFGPVLRRFRTLASLSQEDLAERSGLSVRGISDLERGVRKSPRLETVRMIADGLVLSDQDRATLIAAARPGEISTVAEPIPESARSFRIPPPPRPPTKLVGRDKELRQVVASFQDDDIRLITLTGEGGIGKTRLSLAVARLLRKDFREGTTFLDLSSIRSEAAIPSALAAHLMVEPRSGETLVDALVASIGDRHCLLVLDNWEQVLEAAPLLSSMLAQCEELRILATSRERLRLRGEREIRLEPLALPDVPTEWDSEDLDLLATTDSVRLFLDRAAEVSTGFDLTAENAADIIEICRRLEGLPLAIELAASRVASSTPAELLEQLSRRLSVLADGPRDLPDRQQTMRNTIVWSFDLLDPDQKQLATWMAVFAGGCARGTASIVVERALAWSIDQGEVVPITSVDRELDALVEKSLLLVRQSPEGSTRILMSETIREFASELLQERTEFVALQDAHALTFVGESEAGENELTGPDPLPRFRLFEEDLANFRGALSWLLSEKRIEEGLRLLGALAWFWTEPRYLPEGRDWLDRFLEEADDRVDPRIRAKAVVAAGDLAQWQLDIEASRLFHLEGLRLWKEVGDASRVASVLRGLGSVSLEQADYAEASRQLTEAMEIAAESGHRWEVAATSNLLGLSESFSGNPGRAIPRHLEAISIWEELGDTAHVVSGLGSVAWAHVLLEELDAAADAYRRALPLAREQADTNMMAWCVTGAGAITQATGGDLGLAVRFFAAADAFREAAGIPLLAGLRAPCEALIDQTRANLGDAAFDLVWEAGARWRLEDAAGAAMSALEGVREHCQT